MHRGTSVTRVDPLSRRGRIALGGVAALAIVATTVASGPATTSRSRCTISGTSRADRLVGTARADTLCGLGGADRIFGRGANDTLLGGPGADVLTGDAGNDRLLGGPGGDVLQSADRARDTLDGGAGTDRATFDAGLDRVIRVERARSLPAGPANGIVVAAAGDIACDPGSDGFNAGRGSDDSCRQKYTAELVRSLRPAAVLGLGDFQYEEGKLRDYRRSYDLSWGTLKSITWPTPGSSHDQYGGGDYYAYFGKRAGPAAFSSYSFDLGAWHLISVNANCRQIGGCGRGSRWERWLRADLAAHEARCTLAFWHFPRWSSGPRHGSDAATDAFVDDLYAAGADVLLTAHDHDYERFFPQTPAGRRDDERGIVEFVVGTGGKSLDTTRKRVANSAAYNGGNFGVLKLTLRPTSYSWEFVAESRSTFRDSGTGRCH